MQTAHLHAHKLDLISCDAANHILLLRIVALQCCCKRCVGQGMAATAAVCRAALVATGVAGKSCPAGRWGGHGFW